MPLTVTVKTYLYNVSLTALEAAGGDVDDGGKAEREIIGSEQAAYLLTRLTNRQRQVALLLQQGYTRREIAEEHLGVCLQAIHQIIPRMRKRLSERGGMQG
jgi:DNA-binding NarL/FixJ family response regulator